MTSFFSDLEEQLRTAARDQTSGAGAPEEPRPPRPRRSRWAWLAGGARLVPVAAAVLVTLAVVAGALMLLGHRGNHASDVPAGPTSDTSLAAIVRTTPPGQLKREFALMGAATRKVLGARPCRVAMNAPARMIKTSPGSELLSTLGLLRRPATAADRLPPHALALAGTGVSVYAGAARRAPTGFGGRATFIVPIRESAKAGFPSDRCFALQTAAVKQALPSMPRSLRARTWALTNAFIAADRSLAARPPVDGICQITIMPGHGLSSGCGMTVAAIKHGMLPEEDNGTFSGLVPEGVATVQLRFAAGGGRAAQTVTAQVHDNVYSVHAPGLPAGAPVFPTVVWRAADGKVLKTYSEPPEANPQTLKQVCARHPSACAPMVLATSATAVGHSAPVRPLAQRLKGGG